MQPIDKFLFGLIAIVAIIKGGIFAIIAITMLVLAWKAMELGK